MLEPDTESDSMEHQYTEMKLSRIAVAKDRDKDVREWKRAILTKEQYLQNLT